MDRSCGSQKTSLATQAQQRDRSRIDPKDEPDYDVLSTSQPALTDPTYAQPQPGFVAGLLDRAVQGARNLWDVSGRDPVPPPTPGWLSAGVRSGTNAQPSKVHAQGRGGRYETVRDRWNAVTKPTSQAATDEPAPSAPQDTSLVDIHHDPTKRLIKLSSRPTISSEEGAGYDTASEGGAYSAEDEAKGSDSSFERRSVKWPLEPGEKRRHQIKMRRRRLEREEEARRAVMDERAERARAIVQRRMGREAAERKEREAAERRERNQQNTLDAQERLQEERRKIAEVKKGEREAEAKKREEEENEELNRSLEQIHMRPTIPYGVFPHRRPPPGQERARRRSEGLAPDAGGLFGQYAREKELSRSMEKEKGKAQSNDAATSKEAAMKESEKELRERFQAYHPESDLEDEDGC